jgi:hypothetical protein
MEKIEQAIEKIKATLTAKELELQKEIEELLNELK